MHHTDGPGQGGGQEWRRTSFGFWGIDWGGDLHHFCLVDVNGEIAGERPVAHTVSAIHEALQWVRARTGVEPAAIAVGIETPRGVLVDTLLEHGDCVFALNPKQLDRFC